MFKPGDVVKVFSDSADKTKYHLCVSLNGCFLFLNSPKVRTYPGDCVVDCTELPFLPPTASGKSIISLSVVLRITPAQLQRARAQLVGRASLDLLKMIVGEIENSPLLSDEDRDAVLDGLGDWL
jgi:hypothetical protein